MDFIVPHAHGEAVPGSLATVTAVRDGQHAESDGNGMAAMPIGGTGAFWT
ncbi:hypothetical protein [Streptomyces sp. NPDC093109]